MNVNTFAPPLTRILLAAYALAPVRRSAQKIREHVIKVETDYETKANTSVQAQMAIGRVDLATDQPTYSWVYRTHYRSNY